MSLNAHCNDIYSNVIDLSDLEISHRRYEHLGVTNVVSSGEGMSGIIDVGKPCGRGTSGKLDVYEQYAHSKQHRAPFPVSESRSKEESELVHTGMCGDSQERVYFLKRKSQVFQIFLDYKAVVEDEYGKSPKTQQSGRDGECVSDVVEDRLSQNGITHASMLADCDLEGKCLGEAVNTAIYFYNRSPTMAVGGKTPLALTGNMPQAQALRVFGAQGYAEVSRPLEEDCSLLERKSVGYDTKQGTLGYRLNPDTGKVFSSG